MSKNFDKEACPVCSSEDYDCVDYEEDFNGEEAWQQWRCHCNECDCMFDMERIYKLIDVSVSRAHGN
jgi:hypothetical protein